MRPMSLDFDSRRSMVIASRGVVATSNPLAAQAGLAILRQGGNATDAAIATAAVLNVTEPASTGIGGDCFALYFDAKTKSITALNASGRAPAALTIEAVQAVHAVDGNPLRSIPTNSPHSVTVPGAAAGWEALLQRHGSMTLKDVLQDAIHYARYGYPVAPIFQQTWQRLESTLREGHNTANHLPNNAIPTVGQIIYQTDLADTFEAVAEGGAEAFYTGRIGSAIVDTLQSLGGLMTLDDLKNNHPTWHDPISTTYRGVTLHECPPNGQGLAALIALNIAENVDLGAMAWDSPERLHLMIECMRLAFADAKQYVADPATNPAPLDFLLSKDYAAARFTLIASNKAMKPPAYGTPGNQSDTVYLSVVDGDGNACSFINSLYKGFGTGIVAQGTGVFLQNRGAGFSLDPDHPNALAGGKRPYHTIIPAMATKDGELWACFGNMGGFMQPQAHFQHMVNMVDDNLNPQDSANRPRFCVLDGRTNGTIALEDGIPVKTMARLAQMGHHIQPISEDGRWIYGDAQIIRRDAETGVLYAGSDPRKDGLPAAY